MTGPLGNSEFCFPRILLFPETNIEGNKIHCSPKDQLLSDLLYSQTKQKQILKNALYEILSDIRPPLITCNSGQHFAGSSELFPV